jgi:hypothetical protein
MTLRPARFFLLLAAIAALPGSSAGAASTGAPPLTNEDVVRLVMTGTPEKDILAHIESRAVDFDLSADTIEELRQAGVNERVIEAMRRRQAAMPKSAVPSGTPAPASGRTGILRLEFTSDASDKSPSAHSAIALKSLPRGIRRRGGMEVGLMTDMALAVLCITSDHVPDHWDTRSPLVGAPRHELLLFKPQSGIDKIKGHEVLYLDHQPSYEIPVPEGSHNIVVAAAGKQAGPGTWRLLESDGARVTIKPGGTTRVALRARSQVKGSSMTGYGVDSEWKIVAVENLEGGAGDAAATAAPGQEAHP